MDYSILPVIGIYLMLLPLFVAIMAYIWEEYALPNKSKTISEHIDQELGYWGYWRLVVRYSWHRETGKAVAMELGVTIAAVAVAAVAGGKIIAIGVGVLSVIAIFAIGISQGSRNIHERQRRERLRLRNVRTLELRELKQLRIHIEQMLEKVSDHVMSDQRMRQNMSIWINAGQDLIESRFHGVLRDSKYAALRSILNASEKSGHAWQQQEEDGSKMPVLFGVFCTFVSWWEQRDPPENLELGGDYLRYGLRKFIDVMNERIEEIELKLGG